MNEKAILKYVLIETGYEGVDCIHVAWGREQRRPLLIMGKNIRILQKADNLQVN
jgi:hypothetical protein